MSILIKGVRMPTSCYDCNCFIRDSDGSDYCCLLMQDIEDNDKRDDNCPLVPVPAHGRLIDADALDTSILQAGFSYAITRRNLRYTLGEVRQKIANAPTIIESEKE